MVERVEPTAVTPVIVDPIPLAPVAVVVPPGAVTGTVVAVQGQNVVIPAGYAAGAEWQVMLPTTKVVQQSGLVGMAQLLGGADRIHINQRMMMFEALSCGMFEQKNKYDIRIGDKEGPTVMVATEESKPWTRLCCAPRHSAFVYFAPAYDQNNVLLTMERPGCKCDGCFDVMCCVNSPKPCTGGGCYTCHDMCVEEVTLHDGMVTGEPGVELQNAKPLAVIRQPMQCCTPPMDGCTPTLDVFPAQGEAPYAQITGPTLFGGCSELCCESHFRYTSDGREAGQVTHLTPKSPGEVFKAICTDSDNYGIEFAPGASEVDKANMIAGSVLLDYMFFEIDNGLVHVNPIDRSVEITCCLCFCWGNLTPCVCKCGGKNDDGGAGLGALGGLAGGGPPRAEDGSVSGMPWLTAQN